MRTYELVFVADPRTSDDEVTALADEYKGLLTAGGAARVTKTEFWGRRKLAYEVEKVNEGKYVVVYFVSENGSPPVVDVERRLQQNDKILRFLTVRTDEDLKRAGLPLPLEEVVAAPPAEGGEGTEGAAHDDRREGEG